MTHEQRQLKIRLTNIIESTERIAKLTARMRKDSSYINDQYLQMLKDDAKSIIWVVEEIKQRRD